MELPWPPAPDVELDRISADFLHTTGRHLALELRWDNYPDGGFWVCDVSIDGHASGGTGLGYLDDDPEQMLAGIADSLCEGWLHEEVWGGWPLCDRHPTRPMWARTNELGRAVWICEADRADQVEIGQLGA